MRDAISSMRSTLTRGIRNAARAANLTTAEEIDALRARISELEAIVDRKGPPRAGGSGALSGTAPAPRAAPAALLGAAMQPDL
ncbi:MAG TPA: hypothetical protein VFK85_15965, partial [Anaeromyxobacteraceae bacterium]|nr:hypothetical protein [Anaeromyxobacteraceae bacterium]